MHPIKRQTQTRHRRSVCLWTNPASQLSGDESEGHKAFLHRNTDEPEKTDQVGSGKVKNAQPTERRADKSAQPQSSFTAFELAEKRKDLNNRMTSLSAELEKDRRLWAGVDAKVKQAQVILEKTSAPVNSNAFQQSQACELPTNVQQTQAFAWPKNFGHSQACALPSKHSAQTNAFPSKQTTKKSPMLSASGVGKNDGNLRVNTPRSVSLNVLARSSTMERLCKRLPLQIFFLNHHVVWCHPTITTAVWVFNKHIQATQHPHNSQRIRVNTCNLLSSGRSTSNKCCHPHNRSQMRQSTR